MQSMKNLSNIPPSDATGMVSKGSFDFLLPNHLQDGTSSWFLSFPVLFPFKHVTVLQNLCNTAMAIDGQWRPLVLPGMR